MTTHSSGFAWRIPGTRKPGGLPSMGSNRIRHDWSDLAAAAATLKASTSQGNTNLINANLSLERKLSLRKKLPPPQLLKRWYSWPLADLLKLFFHKMWGRHWDGDSLWHRRECNRGQDIRTSSFSIYNTGRTGLDLPTLPAGTFPDATKSLTVLSQWPSSWPSASWLLGWEVAEREQELTALSKLKSDHTRLCHHPPSPPSHSMYKSKSLQWPHGI